jgi:type I protein arginine methyltransferase
MDVGSGTGILSIFAAQAGASKVYAVEASNLAILSREIIRDNDFHSVIEVVNCKIEDFKLPEGQEKVDVIISEWMGFYVSLLVLSLVFPLLTCFLDFNLPPADFDLFPQLLHEGMLDSVILARDRFLKPGGLLFPDRAIIYCSPCSLPSLFEDWENVNGVKMPRFGEHLRRQKSSKPEILNLDKVSLLADDTVIAFLDLNDVPADELDRFDFNEVIVARKAGNFQGICIWFDVLFPSSDDDVSEDNVTLSTHPQAPPTHWKQTIIPLPANIETLEPLSPVAFKLIIQRNPENARQYHLLLEILDATGEEVEHSDEGSSGDHGGAGYAGRCIEIDE